ncbi:hypothetical protein ELG72_37805 [Rhizobium leguminosarum]|uniref:hypothetical protein n=1 Tax=Rhizobium leguminosarum TaxID=384 RepID=UPI00103087A4|nr:hypothetical protein [Rhizobium leguminosarum]TBF87927.1 hypothetical protein ELG82_37720 [Rhizobium leguminosarum]TBG07091.1 hypothetical protein ELG80_36970 [Rhizobium leguminosarum]TBG07565.1 hypothetical protein ELG81_37705 [Rhizobium leguminosarum]TBG30776.1 hypothetical protein ELG75_36670 [Rhizobium leguminosarum]TBG50016.1 hypothetical protein ELG72_37805 [Rhizobium leguminosarum]
MTLMLISHTPACPQYLCLDFGRENVHIACMTKQTTQRVSGRGEKLPSAPYKGVGTLSDGVVILSQKSKPKHFTSREIKTTIEKVRRNALTGRFLDASDAKK